MTPSSARTRRRFALPRPTGPDALHLADILRNETVGGVMMLIAAVCALLWANLAPASYDTVLHTHIGPLSVGHWASDGLLTIFFFVAGLELKRELTEGSLARPKDALVPIVAAICGMAVPAGIYVLVNTLGDGSLDGWAIPMATDIAFAVAVLAIAGRGLPTALRAFLLTLAIVDDLGAILVIAVAFTSSIAWGWLAGAVACMAVWAVGQRRKIDNGWLYVPLGVLTWWCMLQSGVHATIAGVALGLLTRNTRHQLHEPLDRWRHNIEPLSAGIAVPIFALFAAGVTVSGELLASLWTNPISLGLVLGLVVGKLVGVFGGAWLTTHLTAAELGSDLEWVDIVAVAQLAGIGFTVSLLINDLSFAADPAIANLNKGAVITASLISAVLGAVLLRRRAKKHAAMGAYLAPLTD